MRQTVVLDENAEKELKELAAAEKASKSTVVRKALNELYLKEKRASESLTFFIDMYNNGIISKDMLFLLLPERDAEAVIIGVKIGREAAEIAKEISG